MKNEKVADARKGFAIVFALLGLMIHGPSVRYRTDPSLLSTLGLLGCRHPFVVPEKADAKAWARTTLLY